MSEEYGPNSLLVDRFFDRLELLLPTDVARVVETWRTSFSEGSNWSGAEDAVNTAIARTQRRAAQWRLQERLFDLFRGTAWLKSWQTAPSGPAAEAAGQYLAAIAILALVVADEIALRDFAVLYEPFADVIPLDDLFERAADKWPGNEARQGSSGAENRESGYV
jgi:hypothetical protein